MRTTPVDDLRNLQRNNSSVFYTGALSPPPACCTLPNPWHSLLANTGKQSQDTIFLHSQRVKVKLERKREVLYQGWRCKEGWRCGLGTSRATASKSDYHPLLFVNINIIFSFPNLCTCTLHFAWDITWPSLVLASTYGLVVLGSNITRGAGKYCEWAKHSRSCQLISACLLPKPIQLLPSSLSLSTVLMFVSFSLPLSWSLVLFPAAKKGQFSFLTTWGKKSGLRFSFQAPEVPKLRVRKRPLSLSKVAFSSLLISALFLLKTKTMTTLTKQIYPQFVGGIA